MPAPAPSPGTPTQYCAWPNKFQSTCHSDHSHKYEKCCKTLQLFKENANNNPRFHSAFTTKFTEVHGPKGSWYEGPSEVANNRRGKVATMGILSNDTQPQVAGISAACWTWNQGAMESPL